MLATVKLNFRHYNLRPDIFKRISVCRTKTGQAINIIVAKNDMRDSRQTTDI